MYTIMIVDDEKTIRETLPQVIDFEEYGFKVCATARNGEDALKKLQFYQPDVVLLDVCMPILDGLGFLQKLHELKDIKMPYIVMLSGYSDFEYARTAMRYEAKAYLTKPLEENEMIQILCELKGYLDQKVQKKDDEKITQLTRELQKIYHNGDGDRKPYRGYFLMHCIVLQMKQGKEAYSLIRESIEKRIPGGKDAFVRNRGSIFTYLLSEKFLEEYQFSVSLFGRHLLYQLKKYGLECAVLFDDKLFINSEGTFRNDYDTHLYQMLSTVFWRKGQLIQYEKITQNALTESSIEREDMYLDHLKKALMDLDKELLNQTFEKIMTEAEQVRLNIMYIQKVSYRIYYALTDVIKDTGEDAAEFILKPLDWRDESCFIDYGEWRDALWNQILSVYNILDDPVKMKGAGIGDKMISYIRQHFKEQISSKDVADHFYVSSVYLGRCVQKATGVSFKQYLNELRIAEAKQLLEKTDKLIYEIADEVGFKESKYFVSKFTAEVGKTPLEYRKMMRK